MFVLLLYNYCPMSFLPPCPAAVVVVVVAPHYQTPPPPPHEAEPISTSDLDKLYWYTIAKISFWAEET